MVVAGTGHRPNKLGGYSEDVFQKLVSLARKSLQELQPGQVISGMALGWDQALAQAALDLHIPLICAVPFCGQELRWPPHSQKKYKAIMDQASKVVYVTDGSYSARAMHQRNEWMVDNCTHLLALYDGDGRGGTAACVRYATAQGASVKNVWNLWQDAHSHKENQC